MSDKKKMNEELELSEQATKAAELARTNIQRFLDLQSERAAGLIMQAHEQSLDVAARGAGAATELAAIHIRRFLDLQAGRDAGLIMRAHQQQTEAAEGN